MVDGPAAQSLHSELETDTAALASYSAFMSSLAVLPTGTRAFAQVSSEVEALPSPLASFYSSVLSAEVALFSSVLNRPGAGPSGSSDSAIKHIMGITAGSWAYSDFVIQLLPRLHRKLRQLVAP